MEPANISALSGEPREALRARLRALGFDEVRFARAGGQEASLRAWLATHLPHQGAMSLLDEIVAWNATAIRAVARNACPSK